MKIDSMNEKFPRIDVKINDQLINLKNIIQNKVKKLDKEIHAHITKQTNKQEGDLKKKLEKMNGKISENK